jgi:hypothetical protein
LFLGELQVQNVSKSSDALISVAGAVDAISAVVELQTYFDTKCLDGIDYDNFEVVRDLAHETIDLLHQSVDTGFTTSLRLIGS